MSIECIYCGNRRAPTCNSSYDGRHSPIKDEPLIVKLRTHQVRVLKVLAVKCKPLTRKVIAARTAEEAGIELSAATTDTSWAIGYSDPAKRKKFEEESKWGYPSLLTLGLVEELKFDIDGLEELCYRITKKGLETLHALNTVSERSTIP